MNGSHRLSFGSRLRALSPAGLVLTARPAYPWHHSPGRACGGSASSLPGLPALACRRYDGANVSKLLWILARPFLLWPLPVLALLGLLVLGGGAYEVVAFLERQALGSPLALDWGQLIPPDEAMATRQPVVQ